MLHVIPIIHTIYDTSTSSVCGVKNLFAMDFFLNIG